MGIVAVQDANILIDCEQIGLLDQTMQLPYDFQTTDLVMAELARGGSHQAVEACINQGQMTVVSFSAMELGQITQLSTTHQSLSLEDCSVWHLAARENGLLLSGDGALRKKARQAGLRVHGSLWVLDELLLHGLIDQATACQQLDQLSQLNPRLPSTEVQNRLTQWCGPTGAPPPTSNN